MPYFSNIFRILWGLHYLVFGLNKWIVFLPVKASNVFAQQVIDSFYETGYLMQATGIFQIITDLLLIVNRYVSLAVLMASPITLHIFLYTVFTANYNTGSVATGLLVVSANVCFLFRQKRDYRTLFTRS